MLLSVSGLGMAAMILLLIGLLLFLGAHSVQVLAAPLRAGMIARIGEGGWKGAYSLVSLGGLVLIVWGYGLARHGEPLYALPPGLRHLTFALVWAGFIAIQAAHTPPNHIKRLLKHPMVFGVGLWALGHLLVRATPAGLALFGGFLAWAVVDYISLLSRGVAPAGPPRWSNTLIAIAVGTVSAAIFVHLLHHFLIGVSPMG